MQSTQDVFNEILDFKGKKLKFRKWKAKDRKEFIKNLQKDEKIDEKEITKHLVYNCLEDKDICLNINEFKYILTRIRAKSIGEDINFNLICSNCEKEYEVKKELKDIIKQQYKKYKPIKVKDIEIELCDIKNKNFYLQTIESIETEEEYVLIDFLFHINKINDNDTFRFEELIDYFDNLELDIFDEIFDQWDDLKFKIDDISYIECPHCKNKQKYKFDDLPGFFPESWFKV